MSLKIGPKFYRSYNYYQCESFYLLIVDLLTPEHLAYEIDMTLYLIFSAYFDTPK